MNDLWLAFLLGCAVSDSVVLREEPLLPRYYNAIVAENCMKMEAVHPSRDVYDWSAADRFVSYGECNGLTMTGHCLVWHSQAGDWIFWDDAGEEVSRDTLLARMRSHIHAVVGRYQGRLRGWDVVNEALLDDGSLRPSPWLRIIGPDYIELAFRFAHEADPDAELYYNDYSLALPAKRAGVCRLVRQLQAAGVRVDGVGMQSHVGLDYPALSDYEASIDSFAALGVQVLITELDVNVLPSPEGFGGAEVGQGFDYSSALNPYAEGLPAEAEAAFEARVQALFDIYRRHSAQIGRVTLWGFSDADSWLNDWPVKGRTNYPLLFDREGRPKGVWEKLSPPHAPSNSPTEALERLVLP